MIFPKSHNWGGGGGGVCGIMSDSVARQQTFF